MYRYKIHTPLNNTVYLNMRDLRIIYLAISMMMPCVTFSQNLEIISFRETGQIETGVSRKDINGNACALIKVELALADVIFERDVIGDIGYNGHEYLVYMPAGTKRLYVNHSSCLPLKVEFADYEIPRLYGNKVYTLSISLPQKMSVLRFQETLADLTASVSPRVDAAGVPCALVKVQSTIKNLTFGDVPIGNVEYINNQYYVYLPDGTRTINVFKSAYQPLIINVDDFGVSQLKKKQTYILVLASKTENEDKISIICNEPLAMLYVDGKYLGDVSSSYDISNGKHDIVLKANEYYDYEGQIVVSNEKKTFDISLIPKAPIVKKTVYVGDVAFDMIKVEGGEFIMGATKEQLYPDINEKPTHSVAIADFYIASSEVTQKLWMKVMGNNPSKYNGNGDKPVEQVSWEDCQTFIERLNDMTNLQFRLPTEAEWEYAARGGLYNYMKLYSGSNNIQDVAWYGNNSFGSPHIIKEKQPNELGVYDMSGNVSEWCSDKFGMYDSVKQINPTGYAGGAYYVIRGGAWDSYSKVCRVSSRDYNKPTYKSHNLGLRLAM